MKKILALIFLLPISFFSQEDKYKSVYKSEYKEVFKTVVKDRYTKLIKNLDTKHKSKLKKQFKERNETILELIEDSVFLFNKEYKTFLSDVLNEVKNTNPIIEIKDYVFFFNRLPTPNAACFGNDVFMLNTGLFQFLENEDEFAFIVCHEIAHQILDHVNKNITQYVNKVNSKEVKRKIKDVRLTIFGRNKAGMKLIKNLTFNFLKNSRKMELEADSLGLEIFKKTKYNVNAAITALNKLKNSDEALFDTNIKLDSLLNFKEYPFKKYWLEKEESIFSIDEKTDDYSWDKDSLKSHPDINKRIESLHVKFQKRAFKNDTIAFLKLKEFSKYQQISSLLDFNQVDVAFYILLKDMQSKKAKNVSFVKFLATLKKLYNLKLNHNLGKYVSQNSPFTSEKNINQIRLFLHNLELKDIKNIGYYFSKKYNHKIKNNKEFNKNKQFFETLKNK